MLSSIALEIGQLKSASKQFKHRLESFGRREQKMLCNLFIDRIELNRKKGAYRNET